MNDPVQKPSHYMIGTMELKDFMKVWLDGTEFSAYQGGWVMQATQYLIRSPHKGMTVQDLEKAKKCLDIVIQDLKAKELPVVSDIED